MSVRLGWIEKAMMLIPGYRGYKKRELLREDDKILRTYVADILRQASQILQQAAQELVNALGFQAQMILQQPGNPITSLNMLSQRLYNLAAMVEHQEAGFSPAMSRLKMDEPELKKLLEIDNSLIGYANVILETAKNILDQVRASRWFDTRLIITLHQSADEIERIIAERRRFIHGGEAVRGGQLGNV